MSARQEEEAERLLVLAWQIGKFGHADPKRYPRLETLLNRKGAAPPKDAEALRRKVFSAFGVGNG